jgi:hypothetical protein
MEGYFNIKNLKSWVDYDDDDDDDWIQLAQKRVQ